MSRAAEPLAATASGADASIAWCFSGRRARTPVTVPRGPGYRRGATLRTIGSTLAPNRSAWSCPHPTRLVSLVGAVARGGARDGRHVDLARLLICHAGVWLAPAHGRCKLSWLRSQTDLATPGPHPLSPPDPRPRFVCGARDRTTLAVETARRHSRYRYRVRVSRRRSATLRPRGGPARRASPRDCVIAARETLLATPQPRCTPPPPPPPPPCGRCRVSPN